MLTANGIPNFVDRLTEELLKLPAWQQADSIVPHHILQGQHCEIFFVNDVDFFFLAGRNYIQKYMTSKNIDGRRISCQTSSSKNQEENNKGKSKPNRRPNAKWFVDHFDKKKIPCTIAVGKGYRCIMAGLANRILIFNRFSRITLLLARTRIPFSMHLLVTLLTCGDGVFETRSGNRINQIRSNYSFSFSLPLQLYHKEIAILRTTPLSRTWIPFRLPLQLYH